MRTVIDSDNYAASGIETFFFPGGEPHAKLPQFTGDVLLYLKLRTWADVGKALVVQDALRRQRTVESIRSFIPYFPGARQDKDTSGRAPCTFSRMAHLLAGDMDVFDLHNPTLIDWVGGCNFMPADLEDLPMRPEVDFVIAPDKGAVERARSFANAFCPNATLVEANKVRDPATGRITAYLLPEQEFYGTCLVVDDICDGGATFNMLADDFWDGADQCARLELFVSHGIFSRGFQQLKAGFDHIYTTDSFYLDCPLLSRPDFLTVYSLDPLVERLAND